MAVGEKALKAPKANKDISLQEVSDMPEAMRQFVLHFGEMGNAWGVNRSVAQIHALLYIAEAPMTAEQVAHLLALARSNVSTSLRELLAWGLIKRVPVLGDRRDFYTAEADIFAMVRQIALGRKAREFDPTLTVLRDCAALAAKDPKMSSGARKRLQNMLSFSESVDKSFVEILNLPSATLMALIRMGGTLAKFVKPRGRLRRGTN